MKILDKIVDMVIEALENGTVAWRQTWKEIVPMNVFTERPYHGINLFLLSFLTVKNEYSYPFFATFKQITEAGGKVKKGERSYPIVYWKITNLISKEQGESGEENEVFTNRLFTPFYYNVFNLDQTEGIDTKKFADKFTLKNNQPLFSCDQVISNMPLRPKISHDQPGAFYVPFLDFVNVPEIGCFENSQEYYSTLFHELAHSTGHKSRLNRFENTSAVFGSNSYSYEELVAEMASTMLCSHCGIDQTIENSVAYLTGWAKYLRKERKTTLFGAATKAKAAVDFILGNMQQANTTAEEEKEAAVF